MKYDLKLIAFGLHNFAVSHKTQLSGVELYCRPIIRYLNIFEIYGMSYEAS